MQTRVMGTFNHVFGGSYFNVFDFLLKLTAIIFLLFKKKYILIVENGKYEKEEGKSYSSVTL
jgi:hypothetical protein